MNLADMPELELAWYGDVIGTFKVIGNTGTIQWHGQKGNDFQKIFDGERLDRAPTLLTYLTPEGWLRDILDQPDMTEYLQGIRYLSNLTIATDTTLLKNRYELDRILTPLEDCTDEHGVFQGGYEGPCPKEVGEAFESHLATYWESRAMPKFSGVQMKLPVTLYPQGDDAPVMQPAQHTPWSHIMKFPGTSYYSPMAALEWMGLEMAERSGLETAKHALVALPIGLPPAVLVERFDVPQHENDQTQYLISDFCTLTNKDPKIHKYGQPAELLAKKIMEISTDPTSDSVTMLQRHALAYFTFDTDMHMKNLSVLKKYNPETGNVSISMAPVYDTLPIIAIPTKGLPEQSLSIGGKKSGLNINNFVQLGRTLKLDEGQVKDIVRDIAESAAKAAVDIAKNPPAPIANHPQCAFAVKHAATEIVDRVRAFGFDVPEWDPVRPDDATRKAMRKVAADNGPSLAMS